MSVKIIFCFCEPHALFHEVVGLRISLVRALWYGALSSNTTDKIREINKANIRYGLVIQDSEKHEKVKCQTIDIEYEVYVLVINKYYI